MGSDPSGNIVGIVALGFLVLLILANTALQIRTNLNAKVESGQQFVTRDEFETAIDKIHEEIQGTRTEGRVGLKDLSAYIRDSHHRNSQILQWMGNKMVRLLTLEEVRHGAVTRSGEDDAMPHIEVAQ